MAARCQRSRWSTSATLTSNRERSAPISALTTCRFSFSERHPGIRRSNRSSATSIALDGAGDLTDLVGLDDVTLLDVLIALDADAALIARRHLPHVVLEAAKRSDPALVDDDAVADEASLP